VYILTLFTEIGLESAMVVGKDGNRVQEWLEFPNGCICCTVRDDLVMTCSFLLVSTSE